MLTNYTLLYYALHTLNPKTTTQRSRTHHTHTHVSFWMVSLFTVRMLDPHVSFWPRRCISQEPRKKKRLQQRMELVAPSTALSGQWYLVLGHVPSCNAIPPFFVCSNFQQSSTVTSQLHAWRFLDLMPPACKDLPSSSRRPVSKQINAKRNPVCSEPSCSHTWLRTTASACSTEIAIAICHAPTDAVSTINRLELLSAETAESEYPSVSN